MICIACVFVKGELVVSADIGMTVSGIKPHRSYGKAILSVELLDRECQAAADLLQLVTRQLMELY